MMKIEMVKTEGGTLTPVNDAEAEKLTRFKTGDMYTVEIKMSRNNKFHAKVFLFLTFCYQYYCGNRAEMEFLSDSGQFDVFRKNLVVLAGYYNTYHTITGSVRVEAKSLAYSNMTQEEFEQLYTSLINCAMKHIFKDCDENMYNRLMGFF